MNNTSRLLIATILLFLTASPIWAQTFEISPQGEYAYLPPPEGPTVLDCSPSPFLCEFGVSGTLAITANATSLIFDTADLTLTGNESVQANSNFGPLTGPGASALLAGTSLAFVSDIGGVVTYESEFPAFPFGVAPLLAIVDGNELQVTGGRDSTPIDGDGFEFNFTATETVPEPASACLLSMGILSTLLVRRRPGSRV